MSTDKDNNTIKIFDYEDYEYPKFDTWYKESWFDERCDYTEQGVYKGDRMATVRRELDKYMATWAETHNSEADSDEYNKEKESVTPSFIEKYIEKDITPEEAEKLWDAYCDSEEYGQDQSEEYSMNWDCEIDSLSCEKTHFLHNSSFIVYCSCGRWNGRGYGYIEWTNSCDTIGQLIKEFCYKFLDHCDKVSVRANLSSGALEFYGSHHDGDDWYELHAVDESKLIVEDEDGNGEYVDLDQYVEEKDTTLEDCVDKITGDIAACIKEIYAGHEVTDPMFKPYKK